LSDSEQPEAGVISKRGAREHSSKPLQIVNARIEWVTEGKTEALQDQDANAAQAARVDETRSDRAFLERIYGAGQADGVETVSSSWHFTPHDHARAVKIAITHPAVTPFLQGRWSVLGADQVWTRPTASSVGQTVRVHIFDYTSNQMVDVCVENDQVTSVDQRGIHEYPESPHEMATAIELARLHPDLRDEVADLIGHAILRVPSESRDLSVERRCMWVMFTDRDDPIREMPTRYTALVDLGSMEVIACGATPCNTVVDDDHDGTRS
jgi:hypothetical protein